MAGKARPLKIVIAPVRLPVNELSRCVEKVVPPGRVMSALVELRVYWPLAVSVGLRVAQARETVFCACTTRSRAMVRSGDWERVCASASGNVSTGPAAGGASAGGGG